MSVHDHPYVVFLARLTYSSLGCDGLPGGRGVLSGLPTLSWVSLSWVGCVVFVLEIGGRQGGHVCVPIDTWPALVG